MGAPGNRSTGQDLAPFYILKVEGVKLETDITNFVQSVEFESSTDLVDLLKIEIINPGFVFDFGGPDFTTHKVFQPGNEIDMWAGYGVESDAVYLGRAIVDKHLPRYPENGTPVLELRAYDAAKRMAKETSDITTGAKPKRKNASKDKIGASFVKKTHSQMIEEKAAKYGFGADVYPTDKVDTIFQKKDMTDYQFVKGLAAINSMEFWVDYNIINKQWELHWLPNALSVAQRPMYSLDYGMEKSAIFSCEVEYGLSEQITDLQVMYWSKTKGEWQRIEIKSDKAGPDMTYGKTKTSATVQSPRKRKDKTTRAVRQNEIVNEEIKSAEGLRLAAGGHSIDVIPNRRFKDAADALSFAKRWIKARKDHFILLKGECIGIETLKARQVHTIGGLGKRISGDYFFSSVRHKLGGGGQYRCEFQANKVLD